IKLFDNPSAVFSSPKGENESRPANLSSCHFVRQIPSLLSSQSACSGSCLDVCPVLLPKALSWQDERFAVRLSRARHSSELSAARPDRSSMTSRKISPLSLQSKIALPQTVMLAKAGSVARVWNRFCNEEAAKSSRAETAETPKSVATSR